ncbi:efflux RND transporter periplasmic adaptor subunit [Lutibacter sp.]|uniref:efflux RND transporter periplasmic adaptor subunit n=1 Tax=Lutibacter sp. TaxID=1925666 RepID=UPI0035626BC1
MRKTISIILAISLLLIAALTAKYFIDNKQKPKPKVDKIVKTVFINEVKNTTVPIVISANGNLIAKNKIELYSEVQGILMSSNKEFKPGTTYAKGETIIKINSDEFYANLQAQKSNLYNAITAIMPDLKLDFPENYNAWQNYLENFDINKTTQKLPHFKSDKEKFFISGKGVITSYYNVKNLEVKLSKYILIAPFSGIVTESMVNPGTLIRSGQQLGEFIDPTIFEVSVSIKSEFKDLLQVGKEVTLYNLEKTTSWKGKVVRINGKVDTSTQTIKAFIDVRANDLKEGQYVEVALQTKPEENAFEVARNLLIDNSKLFVVKDSVLDLVDVQLLFENKNTVVIKGLENGTKIVSRPIPGAHIGMLVKIYNENSSK